MYTYIGILLGAHYIHNIRRIRVKEQAKCLVVPNMRTVLLTT
jgi:hypothetical protein